MHIVWLSFDGDISRAGQRLFLTSSKLLPNPEPYRKRQHLLTKDACKDSCRIDGKCDAGERISTPGRYESPARKIVFSQETAPDHMYHQLNHFTQTNGKQISFRRKCSLFRSICHLSSIKNDRSQISSLAASEERRRPSMNAHQTESFCRVSRIKNVSNVEKSTKERRTRIAKAEEVTPMSLAEEDKVQAKKMFNPGQPSLLALANLGPEQSLPWIVFLPLPQFLW